MEKILKKSELCGTVNAVDSKSDAHRALICASLCEGKTEIKVRALNDDIIATARCLSSLGAGVERMGDKYTVCGRATGGGELFCGESGSTVRFLLPVAAALEAVRRGENPTLSTREKHERECFVVAKEGADLARIEREIKTMPNYFADYHTTVHFISQEELNEKHGGLPHGGMVIRTGKTGKGNQHVIEYSLKLESNAEFTASVLVACARAVARLNGEGVVGCKTIFDVPPTYLSALSREELLKTML